MARVMVAPMPTAALTIHRSAAMVRLYLLRRTPKILFPEISTDGPIYLWRSDPDYYANRIECTGLYWHFVDLVWIFLFPVFYLL